MNPSLGQAKQSLDVRVALADDHQLVREGLKCILESSPGIHVVGDVESGYLTKDNAGAELALAIRKVASGGG